MVDSAPFDPPMFLRNAHVQTILSSMGPVRWRAARIARQLHSEQRTLHAEDGTRLLVDLDRAGSPNGAVVILIHGWEGSSRSTYQVCTAKILLDAGFDVLRVNLRDHGDSHHLNRELFNSPRRGETASALADFLRGTQYNTTFLAGYSLGGNFALRIANDAGQALAIDGVVAICPPVDPANAMDALNAGLPVYERYFFKKWACSLARKLSHYPDLDYQGELKAARCIDDLNRFFIPRYTGYPDSESYYAAYALTGDRLRDLTMPAWLITAGDDPIIPVRDVARLNPNRHLTIDIQAHGGHCGFIENLWGQSWAERRIRDIFRGLLDGPSDTLGQA